MNACADPRRARSLRFPTGPHGPEAAGPALTLAVITGLTLTEEEVGEWVGAGLGLAVPVVVALVTPGPLRANRKPPQCSATGFSFRGLSSGLVAACVLRGVVTATTGMEATEAVVVVAVVEAVGVGMMVAMRQRAMGTGYGLRR